MASIVWAVGARDDLRDILDYIAEDSLTYGAAMVERILAAIDNLSQHPRLGRKVPEYDDESVRELIVGNYRIVYSLEEDLVVILAITHGSRDLLRRVAEEPWDFG